MLFSTVELHITLSFSAPGPTMHDYRLGSYPRRHGKARGQLTSRYSKLFLQAALGVSVGQRVRQTIGERCLANLPQLIGKFRARSRQDARIAQCSAGEVGQH